MPDFSAEAPEHPRITSAAPQGPPHFLLGMKQEFTVTAAGSVGPIPSAPPAHEMPAESPPPDRPAGPASSSLRRIRASGSSGEED